MKRARILVALVALLPTAALAAGTHEATTRSQAVAGIGMIRLGDTASIGSAHLPHSTYVVLSAFNGYLAKGIRAANPGTTVLAYKASMDLKSNQACVVNPSGCDTGITYAQAVAHDNASPNDPWILRDRDGHPMTGGYPDNYLGDVGSASFQTRWIANVSAVLRTNHLSGVFIDNVLGDLSGWSQGRFPVKYANDSAWEGAMTSFVRHVGTALRRQGFFVAVNAYKPYPDDASWWRRIAPYTSALTTEYWQQNPNNVSELYTADAPSWTGHWEYWQQLIAIAQRAGSSFFGIQYGDTGDTRLMQYGRASFLLGWNGKRGAYFFNPTVAADPWQQAWTVDVGAPLGSRYRVGAGWRRDYTGGTVVVNPSATKSQTFTFAQAYTTSDGRSIRQLTLAPTTASILTGATKAPKPKAAHPAVVKPKLPSILWDGKRFWTRKGFDRWLRSHHVTWAGWSRNHPAAARILARR
jgi:hypothetical protein